MAAWREWLFAVLAVLLIGRIWSYKPMHDPDTRPIAAKDYDERNRIERQYDKEVIKEALREWLDDKFAQFGRWSLMGLAAAVLALIAYMILTTHGWRPPV